MQAERTEQRPLYTTNRASWFSIVSATHLDFNASIVVTRPFISYGFYRRRCCRCGNILNDVQPPSDGCDDKSSESIATQAARWRVPSGRFSRLDSDSIDRSACDNSHNRSRVFVLDRLEDVPRLVEHLNFGTDCVSLGKLIYLAVACDITRSLDIEQFTSAISAALLPLAGYLWFGRQQIRAMRPPTIRATPSLPQ